MLPRKRCPRCQAQLTWTQLAPTFVLLPARCPCSMPVRFSWASRIAALAIVLAVGAAMIETGLYEREPDLFALVLVAVSGLALAVFVRVEPARAARSRR